MQIRSVLGAVALLVCTLLAATAGLQSKGPPPSNWPVKVSLTNSAADGVVSDGLFCSNSADHYCSGDGNVRAEMLANTQGNFVFDTNDRSRTDGGRRLVLNLGTEVLHVDAFIGTIGVTGTNADGNLRTMAVGDPPLSRRTRISWVEESVQFSLRWDGFSPDSYIAFTCQEDNGLVEGRECKRWTASPLGDDARLYSVPAKGGTTETFLGTYSMPFSMTLVRQ